MRVTFYGVRGSIPTPGPATVRYGGNTSCVELRLCDGTIVVLDGGTGIRALGKQLLAEEVTRPIHLLITHVHWDHIIGVPFFAPIFRPETTLILHTPPFDRGASQAHERLFDGEHFPLRMHELPARLIRPANEEEVWTIGQARVTRLRLNHPGGATGFRIDDADGASLVFLTDNEINPPSGRLVTTSELARFAEGASLLIHDAQYLDEDLPRKLGWGHSTVPQVLELARAAAVRRLALFHHDPERGDEALDAVGEAARRWWKEQIGAGEVMVAAEELSLELHGDGD